METNLDLAKGVYLGNTPTRFYWHRTRVLEIIQIMFDF